MMRHLQGLGGMLRQPGGVCLSVFAEPDLALVELGCKFGSLYFKMLEVDLHLDEAPFPGIPTSVLNQAFADACMRELNR